MITYNLPINGIIGETETGDKCFRFTDLLMHLHAAKDFQAINLIINSPGGDVDEAERMIEAINKTGKLITSENSGDVASAASKLFCLPDKQNRFFDITKGQFLIHNPIIVDFSGDATIMAERAKQLKKIETSYAEFYAEKTGTDFEIISQLMAENIPLSPEQIEGLGFATLIKKQELKAVAFYNFNNKKMTNEQIVEKLGFFEAILMKVEKFLNPSIKALMVKDVNGIEIEFPDVKVVEGILPGVTATINGQPAEGEVVMADGSIYVFGAGKLIEVKPAIAVNPEMEDLKKENSELKAALDAAKNAQALAEQEAVKSKEGVQAMKVEFDAFKNKFGEFKAELNIPSKKSEFKKGFYFKQKE